MTTTKTTTKNSSTQTTPPHILEQFFIAQKVKEYHDKLQRQYHEYLLKGANERKLGTDERQMILSFAFEETRISNNQSAFNFCVDCRTYKPRAETTNKFCVNSLDHWNDRWNSHNHENFSCCYECLKIRCDYGFTHRNDRKKPRCPCCNSRHKFHYINHRNLFRSHPCRLYVVNQLLTFNTTTTKRLNCRMVALNYDDNGRNWELYRDDKKNFSWLFNRNSFAWKFSLLYRIILDRREIYDRTTDDFFEDYNAPTNTAQKIHYLGINTTRQHCREILKDLSAEILQNDFSHRNNEKFSYYYDNALVMFDRRYFK